MGDSFTAAKLQLRLSAGRFKPRHLCGPTPRCARSSPACEPTGARCWSPASTEAEPQFRMVLPGSEHLAVRDGARLRHRSGGIRVRVLLVLTWRPRWELIGLIGWFWPRQPLEFEP